MKSYSMHDVCEIAHICPMTDMCFFNAVFREIFPKNLTIDIIREIDDAYVKDLLTNRLVTMDKEKKLCFLTYDGNHNVVSAVKEGTHSFFDYTQHLSVKRNMGFE